MMVRGSLTTMPRKPELWGIEDVAEALEVSVNTAYQWRYRGKLPEAGWIVSGRPVWDATKVRRWIEKQGKVSAK